MPVRTYRDTATANLFGISFIAMIFAIMATVEYHRDPLIAHRWKQVYTIAYPVWIGSGLIGYLMARKRPCVSVPV